MKKLLIFSLILTSLLFTGCSTAPAATPEPENNTPVAEEPNLTFIGKWQRTANYANGELVNTASAITTLKDDGTYTSVGTCSVSGTFGYDMENETVIMTVGSTSCQGISAGYVSSWQYKISEDGMNLTMTTNASGVTVMETFIRLQ